MSYRTGDGFAGDNDGAGSAAVADGEVKEGGGWGWVVEDGEPGVLVVGEAAAVVFGSGGWVLVLGVVVMGETYR